LNAAGDLKAGEGTRAVRCSVTCAPFCSRPRSESDLDASKVPRYHGDWRLTGEERVNGCYFSGVAEVSDAPWSIKGKVKRRRVSMRESKSKSTSRRVRDGRKSSFPSCMPRLPPHAAKFASHPRSRGHLFQHRTPPRSRGRRQITCALPGGLALTSEAKEELLLLSEHEIRRCHCKEICSNKSI
jgi:hypothetical protein